MDIRKLVPVLGPNEAAALLGESEHWRNFARRIQHHPFVFNHLRGVQGHRCPVCGCGLEGNLTIHHVSYINRCRTEDVVIIACPTPKRPNKTIQAPPCEGCDQLARCSSFLALVHDGCHVKIHAHEAKIKNH